MIKVKSIQFGLPDNGCLRLSWGGNQIIDGPEWVDGGERAPAAFLPAQVHAVRAMFTSEDPSVTTATIRARAMNGDAFGHIAPFPVTFAGGEATANVSVLQSVRAVGKHKVRWQWQARLGNGGTFKDLQATEHTIYTVLGEPTAPWEPDGTDPSTLPWVEALDRACGWAQGAVDTTTCLNNIARSVFALGDERKLVYGGSPNFVESNRFKIEKFMDYMASPRNCSHTTHTPYCFQPDCSDIAAIVSTFANLVGAESGQMVLDVEFEQDFRTASVCVIGETHPEKRSFAQHEVAWVEGRKRVWDACLGHANSSSLVPFTQSLKNYKAAALDPDTATKVQEVEFRRLGIKRSLPPLALKPTKRLENLGFKPLLESISRSGDLPRLTPAFAKRLAENGSITTSRGYDNQQGPWLTEVVWRQKGLDVGISIYECNSADEAEIAIQELLANEKIRLVDSECVGIGERCFQKGNRTSTVLLFSRSNLVFKLKMPGENTPTLRMLATAIDELALALTST